MEKCPYCDEMIENNSLKCLYCGEKLENTILKKEEGEEEKQNKNIQISIFQNQIGKSLTIEGKNQVKGEFKINIPENVKVGDIFEVNGVNFEIEEIKENVDIGPKGLGGWLVLLGIGVVVSPLQIITGFFGEIDKQIFYPMTLLQNGLLLEYFFVLSIYSLIIIPYLFLIYFFFNKAKIFPNYYIGLMIVSGFLILLLGNIEEIIKSFILIVLSLSLWGSYLKISKRAKNTFTEKNFKLPNILAIFFIVWILLISFSKFTEVEKEINNYLNNEILKEKNIISLIKDNNSKNDVYLNEIKKLFSFDINGENYEIKYPQSWNIKEKTLYNSNYFYSNLDKNNLMLGLDISVINGKDFLKNMNNELNVSIGDINEITNEMLFESLKNNSIKDFKTLKFLDSGYIGNNNIPFVWALYKGNIEGHNSKGYILGFNTVINKELVTIYFQVVGEINQNDSIIEEKFYSNIYLFDEIIKSFGKVEKSIISNKNIEESIGKLLPDNSFLREIIEIPGEKGEYIGIFIKNFKIDTPVDKGEEYYDCFSEIRGQGIVGDYYLFTYIDGKIIDELQLPNISFDINDKLIFPYFNSKINNFHFYNGEEPKNSDEDYIIEKTKLIHFNDYNGDGLNYEFLLLNHFEQVCGHNNYLVAGYDHINKTPIVYQIKYKSGDIDYWGDNFIPNEKGEVINGWNCGDHGADTEEKRYYQYNSSLQRYDFINDERKDCVY